MKRTILFCVLLIGTAIFIAQTSETSQMRNRDRRIEASSKQDWTLLGCPDWYIGLDCAGYSDGWYLEAAPPFHCAPYTHEVLSGEWGAAIYYSALDSAMWLTHDFLCPSWTTNSNFTCTEQSAWDDPLNPASSGTYDTGRLVIANGDIEIRQDLEIVDLGQYFASPLNTRHLLPDYIEVLSSRYVLLQTYSIKNITGDTLTDIEFYQMLHAHPADEYSPYVWAVFDSILRPDALLQSYVPFNSVHKIGNFRYDITQWNDPPSGVQADWVDWVGFSSAVAPDAIGTNYYVGDCSFGRPPEPGLHWDIERRTLNGLDSLYGEVAGAMMWNLPDLVPGDSTSLTLVLMAGSIDCDQNGVADICDIATDPSLDENHDGFIDGCLCFLIQPPILDFGVVNRGDSKDLNLTIKNRAGVARSGKLSEICDNYSYVGDDTFTVDANDSIIVTVRFEPSDCGLSNCYINAGDATCSHALLTGFGGAPLGISSINDVANDQGRLVQIDFWGSCLDTAGSATPVVQYEIYRRIDPIPAMSSESAQEERTLVGREIRVEGARDAGMISDASILDLGWDYIGLVPAQQQPSYLAIAPTLGDSTLEDGICWSVFFIRAATADPLTYFDSMPDSGYSVDNLAPMAPQGFKVAYNTGSGNRLLWLQSSDEDFQYYRIYRDADSLFTIGPANFVHATADTQWLDTGGTYRAYYKITAIDHAGNESNPASPKIITGVVIDELPAKLGLYQNVPNPFNPNTTIRYDVPKGGGAIRLDIYDVNGQAITTLIDGMETAGRKTITWDGRDQKGNPVSSGLYFYRLKAGGKTLTKKMVLLK